MLDILPSSLQKTTPKASFRARVKLRLLDIPAILELLSGLPEQHFPVAWVKSSMGDLGIHKGLSSGGKKPFGSEGSPGTPPDMLTKVN